MQKINYILQLIRTHPGGNFPYSICWAEVLFKFWNLKLQGLIKAEDTERESNVKSSAAQNRNQSLLNKSKL